MTDRIQGPKVREVRAKLLSALRTYINDQGLKQKEMADRLGVYPMRIHRVMNGDDHNLSIECLMEMCDTAKIEVQVTTYRFGKVMSK